MSAPTARCSMCGFEPRTVCERGIECGELCPAYVAMLRQVTSSAATKKEPRS